MMSKRVKIIIGIVGVIVIAGAALTIIFWPAISGFVAGILDKSQTGTSPGKNTSKPITVVDPAIVKEAEAAELAGNVEQAAAVYEKAIGDTNNDSTKAALYVMKSQIYVNSGNDNEAIQAAEAAYSLNNEDFGAITLLALLYEDSANYAKAAEFYQRAADLNPPDDQAGNKEYYQQKADEMKAK